LRALSFIIGSTRWFGLNIAFERRGEKLGSRAPAKSA